MPLKVTFVHIVHFIWIFIFAASLYHIINPYLLHHRSFTLIVAQLAKIFKFLMIFNCFFIVEFVPIRPHNKWRNVYEYVLITLCWFEYTRIYITHKDFIAYTCLITRCILQDAVKSTTEAQPGRIDALAGNPLQYKHSSTKRMIAQYMCKAQLFSSLDISE
jgi:hypothetical protein